MRTVSPPFIVAFASAPASSNSFTIAALPFVACQRQRRHAIAVHGVDVGARSHQQRHGLRIIVIRGPVQRGRSVDLRGVHVDARPEQRADARLVALFRGVGERRARLRRSAAPERPSPRRTSPLILRQCMCVS